jgi:hypothetical protein
MYIETPVKIRQEKIMIVNEEILGFLLFFM